MKYLLIALVALTAAGLYLSFSETEEQSLYREFSEWKAKFNKNTNSADEDSYRFSVFTSNFKFVEQFNAEQTGTLRLGMNIFADLTNEEYIAQNIGGGLFEYGTEAEDVVIDSEITNDNVDWNAKGAVTPVENQGSCGSCWAFSTKEALEGQAQISGKIPLTVLSAQQLTSCSTASFGCNGGYQTSTFTYTARAGITTEQSYPYTSGKGQTGTCDTSAIKSVFKNTSSAMVSPRNNQNAVIRAVTQQPQSVLVAASGVVFQLYSSGVLNNPACGTRTDHAILMYGYNNAGSEPYYMVKNSWGTGWGQQGMAQIAMTGDGVGMCAIQSSVAYPTGVAN